MSKSIHQTSKVTDHILPIHRPKNLFSQLHEQLQIGAAATEKLGKSFAIEPHTKVTILYSSRLVCG